MTVMILYATVEGQTEKIARFAADTVRAAGRQPVLVNSDTQDALALEGVEAVILAAPVHERRHPPSFERAISAHRDELAARRTLLLSVSLSAAFPDGHEDAEDYLLEMKMRTDFTPDSEALVAGAIKSRDYDYFKSVVVRHVVLRDRDVDASVTEHEFTDWDGLEQLITGFLAAPGQQTRTGAGA
ncbi:flavodoxin domain-containing protein [Oceanibium sediminis]|uniref:flavodoxin domain-containing protein n=1 Tax=Oceanibium sediminis TaxID=2026339 RepID=UPI000DD4CCDB|nr:flavodoxin domain-containing protein [Oceanibium sediminis]